MSDYDIIGFFLLLESVTFISRFIFYGFPNRVSRLDQTLGP